MSAKTEDGKKRKTLKRRENIYEYRHFRRAFKTVVPVLFFFRPFEIIGKENMISGAAMVCSNHSAMIDPFQIAIAFGIKDNVHVIAKIELFKIPLISTLLWKIGMICVDRSINDIESIKASLNFLKKGEKVVIFPEGTRLSEFDAHAAKSGAVKLAERAGVPVIPVFISRKKPFFKKSKIVVGTPYLIEKQKEKRNTEDYARLSEELMQKIQALDTENP